MKPLPGEPSGTNLGTPARSERTALPDRTRQCAVAPADQNLLRREPDFQSHRHLDSVYGLKRRALSATSPTGIVFV